MTDGKQLILGKFERMALLSDFYGNLLTERQQEVIRFYYEQDLSLGEIAEHLKISRQAVHDILKRAERPWSTMNKSSDFLIVS